jgi:hypothetical protein
MNSRERIMKALNLGQPDRVPFADYTEEAIRKKIMGKEHFTAVEFAKKLVLMRSTLTKTILLLFFANGKRLVVTAICWVA